MEGASHGNRGTALGIRSMILCCVVTDGSYTCEHSTMYREAEPLCWTPETNVTLCVNYTQIKKN